MKKIIFTFAFIFSALFLSAQDWGTRVSMSNYFPIGSLVKTKPVTSLNVDITWWNPDKGFPVLGLVGFGFHYDLSGKIETVDFTNASGLHHADIVRHSFGYTTDYAWEIVQPIQHLSVIGGFGSTIFISKMEIKPDSPLMPGDYVTDSNGYYSWGYDYNNESNYNRSFNATIHIFAGATYELPKFNLFGNLSFNFNGDSYIPFGKAVGLNVGIFVPILRR